ncbi:cell division protein FtsN [Siminovitchia acidinfaciens]|uniref:Cell division protein FtsN n=1 Tax=Siminovitchia acidinfaciens TaxID=2321395 RepID=A0A429XWR1_9BACI|nr:TasA family protein [Siminovitchia acidinfaciens]RST72825.1 cell division protein FtsN [Siminovitchia acidinfaciens]
MNIKRRFLVGLTSILLGIALISGGTYAYFSDNKMTDNTFASGTLDLSVNPNTLINVKNIKPGDSFLRNFTLKNNGTLDIGKVIIETDYTVIDAMGDNTEDFGNHIAVEFLLNMDKNNQPIYKTTLASLKNMSPDAVAKNITIPAIGKGGLPSGASERLVVKFSFVDNGKDQNQFQGDSLKLEWKFVAMQAFGE